MERNPKDPAPVSAFQILSVLWAIIALPLPMLLLFVARTFDGRAIGMTGCLIGLFPPVFSFYRATKRKSWLRAVFIIILGFVALTSVIIIKARSKNAPPKPNAVEVNAQGEVRSLKRYSLGNLVPEADQLMMAYTLALFIDPLFTRSQAVPLKQSTAHLYDDMIYDPSFQMLNSALPGAAAEMMGFSQKNETVFLYIPPGMDRSKPHPLIVFLHGSGGNMKAYLWILARLADRLQIVIAAPNHGFGNWHQPDTEKRVASAIAAATKHAVISNDNIHLMGLSNGGLGVCQYTGRNQAHPLRTRILISPVFDTDAFYKTVSEKAPMLVVTGARDDRITLSYVRQNIRTLKAAGVSPGLKTIPDANHFLFFSHHTQMIETLVLWLCANGIDGEVSITPKRNTPAK
jgi:pimeloyl-ACP methyl ester carboxylesterase